jgi:hypothetical protein
LVQSTAELTGRLTPDLVAALTLDERAVIEAATGELGNKPDAVKLGWLKMRTKESWTKQRYAVTVARALEKIRTMLAAKDGGGPATGSGG